MVAGEAGTDFEDFTQLSRLIQDFWLKTSKTPETFRPPRNSNDPNGPIQPKTACIKTPESLQPDTSRGWLRMRQAPPTSGLFTPAKARTRLKRQRLFPLPPLRAYGTF